MVPKEKDAQIYPMEKGSREFAGFVLTSAPGLETPVMLVMNVAVEAAFFRLPS
jgi:hypothetical protein